MAIVETTTIRVRRRTKERLAEEARLKETSVIELLDDVAELLEERRLMEGFERSYEEHGEAIHAEMKDWLDMPGGTPDDNEPDV